MDPSNDPEPAHRQGSEKTQWRRSRHLSAQIPPAGNPASEFLTALQMNGVPHVARLLKRDQFIASASEQIGRAMAEGHRLIVVHSSTMDGSALNVALEEQGINLPFRSGSVELSHDADSPGVLAAAADRTFRFGIGPLRVINLTSHDLGTHGSGLCIPASGIDQLSEVECFFAVEQPTMSEVSRIVGHDSVIIDEDTLSLADIFGRIAVLGRLLEAARRQENVEKLVGHSDFSDLPTAILTQLSVNHCERIRQRRELAVLRGELTTARRSTDLAAGKTDLSDEIDRQILNADGAPTTTRPAGAYSRSSSPSTSK